MRSRKKIRDAIALLSIVLTGSGIALILIKRARSWEFGIILLLLGVILFYIRYFTGIVEDDSKIRIIDAEYERKG